MPDSPRSHGNLDPATIAARPGTILPQHGSPSLLHAVAEGPPAVSPGADQSVTRVSPKETEAQCYTNDFVPRGSGLPTEKGVDPPKHSAAGSGANATQASSIVTEISQKRQEIFSTSSDAVEPQPQFPSSPENVVSPSASHLKGKSVDPSERPNRTTTGTVISTDIQHSTPVHGIAGPSGIHPSSITSDLPNTTLLESSTSAASVTPGPEDLSLSKAEYPPQPIAINIAGKLRDSVLSPWVEDHLWFPRITPYRLFNLLIPAILNTAKAVVTAQGAQTLPITLEWISGIVVFLVLTFAGEYESESHQHLPGYISWIFKIDCMDGVWVALETLFGFERPSYTSTEHDMEHSGNVVTMYRLLVTGATLTFGVTKANLAYSGYTIGTNWVDWSYGVVVTSVLYFLGLYEPNSAGMLRPLFVEDRGNFLTLRLNGFPFMIAALCTIIILSVQIAPVFRKEEYRAPISPVLFYPPLLLLSFGVIGLAIYQWWAVIRRLIRGVAWPIFRLFSSQTTTHIEPRWQRLSFIFRIPKMRAIGEMSVFVINNAIFLFGLYIMFFDSDDKLIPKAMRLLTITMAILWLATSWFLFAGGWMEGYMCDWWPFRSLREGLPERGVTTLVVEPTAPNVQRILRHQMSNWKVVLLDSIVIFLHASLSIVFVALLGGLIVSIFRFTDKAYFLIKLPALIMLVFMFPLTCWAIVRIVLPPLLAQLALQFSVTNRLHWATLALFDEVFDADDFFYFGD